MDKSRASSRKTWYCKYCWQNSILFWRILKNEMRNTIENTLAVEITMSAVKTQAANFKVNLDFPKWEHNRRVFCFE